MTLVILFEEAAVMVSDLMLSNTTPEVFDDFPIRVRKKDDGTPRYGAFPMRKIVRIQDRFHIAYAFDNFSDAQKLNEFVRSLPWPPTPTDGFSRAEVEATIKPLIHQIREEVKKFTTKIQLIISMAGYQTSIDAALLDTPVGRAWAIGSGTKDFGEFLQRRFAHSDFAGQAQACQTFGLSFFAHHLCAQAAGVASLRNRWGVGMEVLCQGAVIDRIQYEAFLQGRQEGCLVPHLHGAWHDR
jgi:hypothetical protein